MEHTTKNETLRLEALAWITEAAGLLDQAHANLRDIDLHRERFGNRHRSGHMVSMQGVLDDAVQLRDGLTETGICPFSGCREFAEYRCDNCDSWFCCDHGSKGGDRQVQDVGAVAYPACCDKCREAC
jgi:hypothetical protein